MYCVCISKYIYIYTHDIKERVRNGQDPQSHPRLTSACWRQTLPLDMMKLGDVTQRLNVWPIYLQNCVLGVNAGKYTIHWASGQAKVFLEGCTFQPPRTLCIQAVWRRKLPHRSNYFFETTIYPSCYQDHPLSMSNGYGLKIIDFPIHLWFAMHVVQHAKYPLNPLPPFGPKPCVEKVGSNAGLGSKS